MIQAAAISEQRRVEIEETNAALQKEVEERKRAEDEVRRLNVELELRVQQRTAELAQANQFLAELAAIVLYSTDAIIGMDLENRITSWNPAADKIFGYRAAELIGKDINVLAWDDRTKLAAFLNTLSEGAGAEPVEMPCGRKDGVVIIVLLTASPIRDQAGNFSGVSVIAREITERKRSEQQLQQIQKLESLGVVAGGVAHDFNNLLVGILGNASLVLDSLPAANPNRLLLRHVIDASEKASALTRQLLAYAGKGRFVIEKINLSHLVSEIGTLLQTSISRNVQLRTELDSGIPPIEADPGQIQQLIMNLVINAAEAIGDQANGTVLITTGAQDMDEAYIGQNFAGDSILSAGGYVALEVHDTGCGMDEATLSKIFDPFFTTKFTGRGLGLAAVVGIVRGHRGAVRVYSIPGKGTTFKVLLPAAEGVPSPSVVEDRQADLMGSGTILVIDDEPAVRQMATAALESYGYTVLLAQDGEAGVELFRRNAERVAAILLDMTMPVLSGQEAFRRIKAISPQARVIVSSGYNEVEAVRRFTAKGMADFIQKPYTSRKLARIVKRALSLDQNV